MPRLCRPNEEPPDGWIYTQPDTGGRWNGESLHKLVEMVREHRVWKNLDRQDYESVRLDIERQICSGMPEGLCAGEPGEKYQPIDDKMRTISMEQVMEFSMASFRFVESGGELVDKAESVRRAAICRGCRFNRPSPCIVCTPVFKLMDAFIPESRKEPGLSACGVCGCSIRAKILLPMKTILTADAEKRLRYPPHCWLNDHGVAQKESAQGEVPA